ncbi:MAG TPA: NAD(P)-binding domain-containing protein [Prolixibacteraceae bacterium]
MKTTSLGFIGGGRITKIFLQALANKKVEFQPVVIFDTNADVLGSLKQQFPGIVVAQSLEEAAQQSTVLIALHPPMIMETLGKIAEVVPSDAVVISLAPKITIEKIESILKTKNIVRLIPNATSYINEGYNPVTFSTGFDENKKPGIMSMLKLLGNTFEVAEPKLEAYALISAMLPTYFWFQWNELETIGTQLGLSQTECRESVYQTLNASLNTMYRSGMNPAEVMNLIPVKPIGENEAQIRAIYQEKLVGLWEKIKP